MPGVSVGGGALVVAGSIDTKSLAPHIEVCDNFAKYIFTIEKLYERNTQYNLNIKNLTLKKKEKLLFSLPDNMFIKK